VELARRYVLRCAACGDAYADDGARLSCERAHAPALLRTVYDQTSLAPTGEGSMLRFGAWLPLARDVRTDARTAVYRAKRLGAHVGLERLWVAFNGWWPERGATLATATFKELEAVAVLGRLAPDERRPLVVASAGNTAAAFAAIAGDAGVPVVIVIPEFAWAPLAALVRVARSVRTIVVRGGTYDDAIALAAHLVGRGGYLAEGGVRNVARRDGMGTVMLAAVEAIGALPDAYVQAVGSGAGALAAHEAALRIIADGRFGDRAPRLVLGQNAPFAPLHDAWSKRAHALDARPPHEVRARQAELGAPVLGNSAPPYAVAGGVREALAATRGATFAIGNGESAEACALFEAIEGVDVEAASGVALATLQRAVNAGTIAPDATVLLNVTGGGRARRPRVTVAQRPTAIVPAGTSADPLAVAV